MKSLKVSVIVLGCSKNTVEAEYLLGSFNAKGFIITANAPEADVIVVHTCSFIGDARIESEAAINYALSLKKFSPHIKVYATGCLAQLLGAKLSKTSSFKKGHNPSNSTPLLDGYLGTGSMHKLPDLILRGARISDTSKAGGFNDNKHRILSSPLAYAYLKISEGCNHKCSFCIIPRLRGKYQSRTVASLTDEAKVLADSGIKELILVAQDTTSYGKDLYNRFALDKLLKNLCNISGIKRVRLMYAYPSSITKNLLNVIADYQEICNYIDVPVQHISPDVLGAMNRPVNTRSIIYDIIKKLPKVALRTTFISGFPSETKKDFNELLSFAQEGHFMYAGVFAYSDETLAGSHKIRPKVSAKLATKRKIILEKAQQTIFANKVCSLLGTTQELFIESCVKSRRNYLIKGRVPCQAPTVDGITFLESPKPLKVPSVKKVVITGHEGYNIKAKLI